MKIKRIILIALSVALALTCVSCKSKPEEVGAADAEVELRTDGTESVPEAPASETEQIQSPAPELKPAPEQKTEPQAAPAQAPEPEKSEPAAPETDAKAVPDDAATEPVADGVYYEEPEETLNYKYTFNPEHPDVDGMPVLYYSEVCAGTSGSLDRLIEFSDLVVIGTSDTKIVDCKQYLRDRDGKTCDFEHAYIGPSYIERVFKIEKVLKGDPSTEEVTVMDFAKTDGQKIHAMSGQVIAKPGHRYLLFLEKPNYPGTDCYCTGFYEGEYDLDEPGFNESFRENAMVYSQVKARYADEFKND